MKKYIDKNKVEAEPFDVIKVFHFIGARKKCHYMYKQVVMKDDFLYINHLMSEGGCSPDALDWKNVEIVQSRNWEKLK
jgi:hypothetical protein